MRMSYYLWENQFQLKHCGDICVVGTVRGKYLVLRLRLELGLGI